MWFKRKTGLVRIEGSIELFANTFLNGKFAGISAYTASDIRAASMGWFRSKSKPHSVYLACFQNDHRIQRRITEAFGLIETAIRNGDEICDLSGIGDDDAWQIPPWGFLAGW